MEGGERRKNVRYTTKEFLQMGGNVAEQGKSSNGPFELVFIGGGMGVVTGAWH